MKNDTTPVVVVHGGAWAIPNQLANASITGVKKAATLAHRRLQERCSALDAVEAAIQHMEDDPVFDAGTGSVLNSDGEVEMDAAIMDGATLDAGAVACVQNISNPIKLARLVLDTTDHVLLVGKGANKFAEERGMKQVPTEKLVTKMAHEEWKKYMKFRNTVDDLFRMATTEAIIHGRKSPGHDTVGAVALDVHRSMAFGTSTGGITAKRPGRVGDSPLLGAGGYADNETGSVSTTGHGEAIMKVCLARYITGLLSHGYSVQVAVEQALSYMQTRVGGCGGAVVINNRGDVGKHFTTDRMAWAWVKENVLHYGINPNDDFTEFVD